MEKIREKIVKFLTKKYELEAIIIFGSYARNTQNEESDIDIAMKSVKNVNIQELKIELEDLLKKDIDLIDLDKIENEAFRYEILMTGELIYVKDQYKFDLYKIDMFREYFELNEMRQDIINNIKNGGDIYGK